MTATDSVTEADGQVITYTATVDNAPLGSNLLLTLNNGGTITILAGETTGTVHGTLSGGEDVYDVYSLSEGTAIDGTKYNEW
ncbi:MAG: immunoglobulin-like domain-containing protein [Candidatus Limnocylindrales bacterium]